MKITICGCGNAAQLMAAIITNAKKNECFVFAPFKDEAARFREAINAAPNNQMEVVGPDENAHLLAKIDTTKITEDPNLAITGADLILLPLPAFAVEPTLRQISPYIKRGAFVGILPGQGGCQWAAAKALGSFVEKGIVLFATEKLPYNVRIVEFGRMIHVYAYKPTGIGAIPADKAPEAAKMINECVPFSEDAPLKSILLTTLSTGNQCIHPVRVRSLHKTQPYSYNPLFYEEMDDDAVRDMQAVSDEIAAIAKGIQAQSSVNLDELLDVRTALIGAYGSEIEDPSTLMSTLKTAEGFKGITSPMKQVNGDWVVDFRSRYIVDDVPYGLCVLRGLAELVDVETPTINSLIMWAQEELKRSYLVDGKLVGDDVKNTGAPQAFGFASLKDLPDIA